MTTFKKILHLTVDVLAVKILPNFYCFTILLFLSPVITFADMLEVAPKSQYHFTISHIDEVGSVYNGSEIWDKNWDGTYNGVVDTIQTVTGSGGSIGFTSNALRFSGSSGALFYLPNLQFYPLNLEGFTFRIKVGDGMSAAEAINHLDFQYNIQHTHQAVGVNTSNWSSTQLAEQTYDFSVNLLDYGNLTWSPLDEDGYLTGTFILYTHSVNGSELMHDIADWSNDVRADMETIGNGLLVNYPQYDSLQIWIASPWGESLYIGFQGQDDVYLDYLKFYKNNKKLTENRSYEFKFAAATPEPASILIFGLGITAAGLVRRISRKR